MFCGVEDFSNFGRGPSKVNFSDFFLIEPLAYVEKLFKCFFYFISGGHFFSGAERFSNYGRESSKEHFYKIILEMGHMPKRRCDSKVYERNRLSHCDRGSPKEHFCENILKLCHCPSRRRCLKGFLFFSSDTQFVQRS